MREPRPPDPLAGSDIGGTAVFFESNANFTCLLWVESGLGAVELGLINGKKPDYSHE